MSVPNSPSVFSSEHNKNSLYSDCRVIAPYSGLFFFFSFPPPFVKWGSDIYDTRLICHLAFISLSLLSTFSPTKWWSIRWPTGPRTNAASFPLSLRKRRQVPWHGPFFLTSLPHLPACDVNHYLYMLHVMQLGLDGKSHVSTSWTSNCLHLYSIIGNDSHRFFFWTRSKTAVIGSWKKLDPQPF